MIEVKAIDHICLWVRALPEAKTYYETVFGFACVPKDGDDSTLVVESEHVHFFVSESPDQEDFLPRQHISFQVDSLDAVIQRLRDLNVTHYDVGEVQFFTHKNYKWCEWRDPSGIRLECVEII